ncbi:MAG TPA: glycoside hydrolase family 5 protein [Opitutus sp.]|nr:glycoside hydrolase family 5 protein [Opitutus sp.]
MPVLAAACLLLPAAVRAQLPSPAYGWNLGNTLEPPSGEGSWGPPATQALINAVADAGFNTVRIPCAWNSHANQATLEIDPVFMARVKQVVDWCYARNLTVVVNDHWDGGWLENNITASVNPALDAKMKSYWTQIATAFADYDDRLLFAGANEPDVKTAAQMATLMTYYNTFIAAVRGTGGINSSRWLVVQGPGTDIDTTMALMDALPTDSTPGRLMVEVHYYSPYQFCLMNADADWGNQFYFWGQGYHSTADTAHNPTWGEEDYLDTEFQKMTDKFVSAGIPVMVGEFEAMKRTTLTDPDLSRHLAARTYFHHRVVESAQRHGLAPFYWDTPGTGEIFNWTTGAVVDPDNARALTGGAALAPPGAPPLPPSSRAVAAGGSVTLAIAPGDSIQWQRNGVVLDGQTADRLALAGVQPADAGIYSAAVTDGSLTALLSAVVGVTSEAKVIGTGTELLPANIVHPNGNIFDQVLVTGMAETITADAGQVTRTSFIDLDDDIVQVEFAGAGALSLVLDDPTGPAAPVNYTQAVNYMKGHAGIVIVGADETTNVSVFTVGRATAFDPTGHYNITKPISATNDPATNGSPLFAGHEATHYDGVAGIAFIAIQSRNGMFGGVRTANANYFAHRGLTGLYAPGIAFSGPIYLGNLEAFDAAVPVIQVGAVTDARITGGNLHQDNGAAVQVSGLTQLRFTAGSDSAGNLRAAQANQAVLERDGVDVTAAIVVNP